MGNRVRIIASIVIVGLAPTLNGCDRNSATPTIENSETTTSAEAVALSTQIPDKSLTANEYIALGMPAHDREWAARDMAAAVSTLKVLASQSPEQLPRFGSAKSGAVFARIVTADNLKFCQSRSLPLEARFPQALEYSISQNEILKIYLSARVADKVTGNEIVELMGAQLRGVQVQLRLLDEYLPTLSREDPKYAVRMAGHVQMRQGFATMVSSVIVMLTETNVYDAAMRSRLLEHSRATFPDIVARLAEPSQQEILKRLDELAADTDVQELQAGIGSLRDEVRAATKTRK